jgi:deazaflavin-dependent oxidoreductase (nitroreductase family)
MNEPIDTSVRPPSKLLRMFYRFPIYLYRIGLGRLMGKRFIHIQHTGRKSELPRHSVVEVAGYDPKEDAYYIAAAYGEKADWFRNMMKTPQVKAQVGGRHFDGMASRLTPDQTFQLYEDYEKRHPGMIFTLSRLVGSPVPHNEEGLKLLAQKMPAVRIKVVKTQ